MPTPSAEPREYRILTYLKSSMLAISAGSTYWNTLGEDQVIVALTALPPKLPGVAIRPVGWSSGYDAPLTGYSRPVVVQVEVYAQVAADGEQAAIQAVARLTEDVLHALESDRGLGSGTSALVFDVRISTPEEQGWIRSDTGAIGRILRIETTYETDPGAT